MRMKSYEVGKSNYFASMSKHVHIMWLWSTHALMNQKFQINVSIAQSNFWGKSSPLFPKPFDRTCSTNNSTSIVRKNTSSSVKFNRTKRFKKLQDFSCTTKSRDQILSSWINSWYSTAKWDCRQIRVRSPVFHASRHLSVNCVLRRYLKKQTWTKDRWITCVNNSVLLVPGTSSFIFWASCKGPIVTQWVSFKHFVIVNAPHMDDVKFPTPRIFSGAHPSTAVQPG